MNTAYRFDDFRPQIGSNVYAFRTLEALKNFANMQGDKGNYKFWEINGEIVSDDGTIDGIVIRVSTVVEVQ